jgi:universal stress protein E
MLHIRNILVAVKRLESPSLPAVLKAAQIARACGAELELFHGLAEPLYTDLYGAGRYCLEALQQQVRLRARHKLETIADRLRRHSIRVTVTVDWDYPAYEAIVRRALQSKADLIVAQRYEGRHSASRVMRLTDWELVRTSPVPVLLVKDPHPYRHPPILAAIDPSHKFAKPLQLDKLILSAAGSLSRALHGALHAVHGYIAVPINAMSDQIATPQSLAALARQSKRTAAAGFSRELRAVKIARSRRYLIAGRAIDAISEAAKRSRSAIVVMGAVSRSGIKRLLIGNSAERILDELTCDILVLKPQSFRTPVPAKQRGAQLGMAARAGLPGYY